MEPWAAVNFKGSRGHYNKHPCLNRMNHQSWGSWGQSPVFHDVKFCTRPSTGSSLNKCLCLLDDDLILMKFHPSSWFPIWITFGWPWVHFPLCCFQNASFNSLFTPDTLFPSDLAKIPPTTKTQQNFLSLSPTLFLFSPSIDMHSPMSFPLSDLSSLSNCTTYFPTASLWHLTFDYWTDIFLTICRQKMRNY